VRATIKPKHQRLVLVLAALAALIAAALLAAWALRNQASYFYLPAEMASKPPAADRAVRLGGMVDKGSIQISADQVTISFVVSDGIAKVPVTFRGIAPDLFKEGSGVVAEGHRRADGTFVADNLLAKHDEKYVPREMRQMSDDDARKKVAKTE
jgi:cytochrome c-type biogenesis protein CcmE